MHNLQTGAPDSPVGSGGRSPIRSWLCLVRVSIIPSTVPSLVMCDGVPPMSDYTGASDTITQRHSHSFATSDTASRSLVREQWLVVNWDIFNIQYIYIFLFDWSEIVFLKWFASLCFLTEAGSSMTFTSKYFTAPWSSRVWFSDLCLSSMALHGRFPSGRTFCLRQVNHPHPDLLVWHLRGSNLWTLVSQLRLLRPS